MSDSNSEHTTEPASREFKRTTRTKPSDLSEYGLDPEAETNQERENRLYGELLEKYRAALLTSEELENTPIQPRLKLIGDGFGKAIWALSSANAG